MYKVEEKAKEKEQVANLSFMFHSMKQVSIDFCLEFSSSYWSLQTVVTDELSLGLHQLMQIHQLSEEREKYCH